MNARKRSAASEEAPAAAAGREDDSTHLSVRCDRLESGAEFLGASGRLEAGDEVR